LFGFEVALVYYAINPELRLRLDEIVKRNKSAITLNIASEILEEIIDQGIVEDEKSLVEENVQTDEIPTSNQKDEKK